MSLAPKHHAPTHAWPSLPINPDPNPAPAEDAISATHYPAAIIQPFALQETALICLVDCTKSHVHNSPVQISKITSNTELIKYVNKIF